MSAVGAQWTETYLIGCSSANKHKKLKFVSRSVWVTWKPTWCPQHEIYDKVSILPQADPDLYNLSRVGLSVLWIAVMSNSGIEISAGYREEPHPYKPTGGTLTVYVITLLIPAHSICGLSELRPNANISHFCELRYLSLLTFEAFI
jgi:hypothetical protein